MIADFETFLALLVSGPQEALTAGWVVAFLIPAVLIGRVLGRPGIEGASFGLLVLTAAADMALFLLRGALGPVAWHLPLTVTLVGMLSFILRRWALPRPLAQRPLDRTDWMLMILAGGAFWALRTVQINPSTSLSSQLGWVPLYLRESFVAGSFLLPGDFAFGIGPVGSLFYSVDMLGVSALAGGLGAQHFYPPYLATSVLGVGLAVLLPLAALRRRPLAQVAYLVILGGLMFADFQVRAGIGRHWGDTVMILGGSLIMTTLASRPCGRRSILTAATAAAFLVLARHYAAFFAALLMIGMAAWAMTRWGFRTLLGWWPAWAAIAGLLGLLAWREIGYILHPTPFYPGGRLLVMGGSGWLYHLKGMLHDWGLMTGGSWTPLGPRSLWLAALLFLLAADRKRCLRQPRRLSVLLAPLAVMLLPLCLELVTGYRSSGVSNKPYLLAAMFGAFYPAFALRWLAPAHKAARVVRIGLASTLAMALLWVTVGAATGYGPGKALNWGREIYDGQIIDRGIALALAAEGVPVEWVADRPLMYFFCEPGMGLRNYVGGSLRQDSDYWSKEIQDALKESSDFPGILARKGWPNLYLSSPLNYAEYVEGGAAARPAELDTLESQPWVERVVRFRDARLVIVKRP
ncbi:DUF751 domain-containing protein [Paramagnetospirillum magneticum]|uniref:Glycosyltransferase RgtA/B/C/D-like domain-containing protein n=1 Tax=Paramagnetospirillum magneticum (strain ATCC 700264 / AMB-1) TaxID=342108 RepID=Q2WB62_PARM1|nr:DUF751 domain-containing protein [Paramagnetospirillum magneticum]BAE48913.1 hypothetical protein amb0109 [Paramagnetospirillum magneticum AMB-1]